MYLPACKEHKTVKNDLGELTTLGLMDPGTICILDIKENNLHKVTPGKLIVRVTQVIKGNQHTEPSYQDPTRPQVSYLFTIIDTYPPRWGNIHDGFLQKALNYLFANKGANVDISRPFLIPENQLHFLLDPNINSGKPEILKRTWVDFHAYTDSRLEKANNFIANFERENKAWEKLISETRTAMFIAGFLSIQNSIADEAIENSLKITTNILSTSSWSDVSSALKTTGEFTAELSQGILKSVSKVGLKDLKISEIMKTVPILNIRGELDRAITQLNGYFSETKFVFPAFEDFDKFDFLKYIEHINSTYQKLGIPPLPKELIDKIKEFSGPSLLTPEEKIVRFYQMKNVFEVIKELYETEERARLAVAVASNNFSRMKDLLLTESSQFFKAGVKSGVAVKLAPQDIQTKMRAAIIEHREDFVKVDNFWKNSSNNVQKYFDALSKMRRR